MIMILRLSSCYFGLLGELSEYSLFQVLDEIGDIKFSLEVLRGKITLSWRQSRKLGSSLKAFLVEDLWGSFAFESCGNSF